MLRLHDGSHFFRLGGLGGRTKSVQVEQVGGAHAAMVSGRLLCWQKAAEAAGRMIFAIFQAKNACSPIKMGASSYHIDSV
ncbi:hypothetical protein LP417_08875 [Polaromonas sp. P1-6]|nr:hypothetical protein LP417_08875 [Polaromonas sp. P1-6]